MTLFSCSMGVARLAAGWGLTVLLVGCGGGGDSGAAAGGALPPAGLAAPPASTGSTCGIDEFSTSALARINALRAAGADCRGAGVFAPTTALTWAPLLTQAAEVHSQDMVANRFFSHTGSNGSTLAARVDATGYAWSGLGENIAAGYAGVDAVMTGWINSDGHCANLMNPNFNQVGLVCVPGGAGSAYSTYWTMDLAKSR